MTATAPVVDAELELVRLLIDSPTLTEAEARRLLGLPPAAADDDD